MSHECEHECAVTPFPRFLNQTPVIPQFYWDVYSAEQRWKFMSCELYRMQKYLETLADVVNSLSATLSEQVTNEVTDAVTPTDARVSALEKALETLVSSMLVYDTTKGKYTASIDQARRLTQILGNPADEVLTVATVANGGMTVQDWADNYMCAEMVNQAFKRFANITVPTQEVNQ